MLWGRLKALALYISEKVKADETLSGCRSIAATIAAHGGSAWVLYVLVG